MAEILHTLDKICLYYSVVFCLSLSKPIYNFLFKLNGRNATELLSQHQLHSVVFGKFLKHST